MLAELRKHAQTGAALRNLVLQKEAGVLGTALKKGVLAPAKKVGAWALANPVKASIIGLGTAASAGAATKTYHSFKPAVQRGQLGMVP